MPGLFFRVWPSGVKAYYATWGRNRYVALGRYPGMTLDGARTKALEALGETSKHGSPDAVSERSKVTTFADFLEHRYEP